VKNEQDAMFAVKQRNQLVKLFEIKSFYQQDSLSFFTLSYQFFLFFGMSLLGHSNLEKIGNESNKFYGQEYYIFANDDLVLTWNCIEFYRFQYV